MLTTVEMWAARAVLTEVLLTASQGKKLPSHQQLALRSLEESLRVALLNEFKRMHREPASDTDRAPQ